ncbi:hypothetical protein RS84_01371 [Microbacterium hydrocarbonoxydans]|uniref:Uncharacterized protein n=1 Tax=Microbacterium hydrocarbonoxydans TaxID=273678 RepID=A0A0M2HTG3_9MICO|nr:hypothetical protein [Microbacterium hydrocarbonoxydans]KJL47743.1 hypothetical protein RS84_01371 [Microbacterium hydrocarbonoxydans]
MSRSTVTPVEVLDWAIAQPWLALIFGAAVAIGITILRPSRPARADSDSSFERRGRARYAPESRTILWTAFAVVVIVIAEHFIRSYVVNMNGVISWWRFATPLFVAGLGIAALVAFISTTGSEHSERPVLGGPRRTWLSFVPSAATIGWSIVFLVLIATTIIAGLLSSADPQGRFVYLEIPIPNELDVDPLRIWFFGWAYGTPTLIALAMLSVFTAMALHANAVRPFLRPETVVRESIERRQIATSTVQLTTAAMLLSLGDAWQFIASSGASTRLDVLGDGPTQTYDVVWRGAEIATALGRIAPLLEITAFTILFLAMRQLRTADATDSAAEDLTVATA